MGYYSSSPSKWNIYKDSIVKVEYNARKQFNGGKTNKKKKFHELHKANYVAVRDRARIWKRIQGLCKGTVLV